MVHNFEIVRLNSLYSIRMSKIACRYRRKEELFYCLISRYQSLVADYYGIHSKLAGCRPSMLRRFVVYEIEISRGGGVEAITNQIPRSQYTVADCSQHYVKILSQIEAHRTASRVSYSSNEIITYDYPIK
jgi:hypothetical protein